MRIGAMRQREPDHKKYDPVLQNSGYQSAALFFHSVMTSPLSSMFDLVGEY
jgi:hypothetical protein